MRSFHRLTVLAGTLALVLGPAMAAAADLVCGLSGPEDLVRVPGHPWVIASAYGTVGRGFSVIDIRSRAVQRLAVSRGPVDPALDGCAPTAELGRLKTQGMTLTPTGRNSWRLYAINHGDRESLEVFDLTVAAGAPQATWRGCLIMPDRVSANAVAVLPGGGLVISKDRAPGLQADIVRIYAGETTGAVYVWTPQAELRELTHARFSGNNGLVLGKDGRSVFVSGTGTSSVHRVDIDGAAPAATAKVAFRPDNLKWSSSGALLATGAFIEGLSSFSSRIDSGVALIDGRTMKVLASARVPADARFDTGTTALEVGRDLWIGSFRSDCLAIVPRKVSTVSAAD